MATYYDGLNDFHKLNEQEPLPVSAQLTYLHLLHINNRLGNSGQVTVSDRELGYRTKLSRQSITNAKRELKNRKLIDFSSNPKNPRSGTTYSLLFFTLGQTVGQSFSVPNIRARVDIRHKTLEKDLNTTIINNAREENFESGDNSSQFDNDFDEIQTRWEFLQFAKLNFTILSHLKNLLAKHGKEAILKAMDKANESNSNSHGVSFKYFAAVLESTVKGGDKFGQRDTQPVRRSSKVEPIETAVEPDYSWLDKIVAERSTWILVRRDARQKKKASRW